MIMTNYDAIIYIMDFLNISTYERRRHLSEGKYFECNCKRCSDPTELNIHLSSIKCNKCKDGMVVPTIPLCDIYTSLWSCRKCSTLHDGASIKAILHQVNNKISSLDMANISEVEDVLKELESCLSSHHYLILELKQNIIPVYKRNLYNDWSMIRIIQLCTDIISVLKIIQPGLSRLRGIALYQLQSTQVALANKRYQCKEITCFTYLPLLIEAQENLTTALKYLLYEPKNSPEGRLAQCALNDLKLLRNTSKQIKTVCDSKLLEKHDILYNVVPQKKNY